MKTQKFAEIEMFVDTFSSIEQVSPLCDAQKEKSA